MAVEKLKTAWVDPTMTETLLALNHMNVVKVLHTEQEALYRYRHTVQFHSFSKCLIFNKIILQLLCTGIGFSLNGSAVS